MNPGDLVMPKGRFRVRFGEPLGPVPGVLLERIRPPTPTSVPSVPGESSGREAGTLYSTMSLR